MPEDDDVLLDRVTTLVTLVVVTFLPLTILVVLVVVVLVVVLVVVVLLTAAALSVVYEAANARLKPVHMSLLLRICWRSTSGSWYVYE